VRGRRKFSVMFDKELSPLYGWMFPEGNGRVNIGICVDADAAGQHHANERRKPQRDLRPTFAAFLQRHYADRLGHATQMGKWKGHPISYTTWVSDCTTPGALYLGEGARITHNATGEGIYQAMQSGVYAADAIADVQLQGTDKTRAWQTYLARNRKKLTASFVVGHALRGIMRTPLLDWVALAYNNSAVRRRSSRSARPITADAKRDPIPLRSPDAITDAANRLDVRRRARAIDLLTQIGDVHVHDVRARIEVVFEHVLEERAARDRLALRFHQIAEQRELLLR
jgi:flavin-dependent dehydrogenase